MKISHAVGSTPGNVLQNNENDIKNLSPNSLTNSTIQMQQQSVPCAHHVNMSSKLQSMLVETTKSQNQQAFSPTNSASSKQQQQQRILSTTQMVKKQFDAKMDCKLP